MSSSVIAIPQAAPFQPNSNSQSCGSHPIDDHYFHPPTNEAKRQFVELIKEGAKNLGMKVESCSGDWLLKISKGNITRLVMGYHIGINSCVSSDVCNDKSATSSALGEVPHVEHRLFLSPSRNGKNSVWQDITNYGSLHNFNVVCKAKTGSGGNNVFHVESQKDLEKTTHKLFSKYPDLCISPFYKIKHEYRVIMLQDIPQVVFRKVRPSLIGDGVSTLAQLIIAFGKLNQESNVFESISTLNTQGGASIYDYVPPLGEITALNWKHNLAQGALSQLIQIPPSESNGLQEFSMPAAGAIGEIFEKASDIVSLARKATRAVGIIFASADVIELEDGSVKIMEINSGVMMENLVRQHGDLGKQIASKIYLKAICILFKMDDLHSPASTTDSEGSTPSITPGSSPPNESVIGASASAQQARALSQPHTNLAAIH